MQKIERYGVIALLFLLVTIVAVTFWSEESREPAGDPASQRPGVAAIDQARPINLSTARPDATAARADASAAQRVGRPGSPASRIEPDAPLDRAGGRELAAQRPGPAGAPSSGVDRFQRAGEAGQPAADPRAAAAPEPASSPHLNAGEGRSAAAPAGSGPAGGPAADSTPGSTALLREPALGWRSPSPQISGSQTSGSQISGTQTSGSQPAGGAPREVVAGPGDSLARIALRHLGAEAHWQAIADLNGIADPKRLQVGQRLRLPSAGALASSDRASSPVAAAPPASTPQPPRTTPVSGASRSYTVRPGDVLSGIAQRECGSVKAIPAIVALNPGLVPDRVVVGQTILLPAGEGSRPADNQVASSSPAGTTGARRNVVH